MNINGHIREPASANMPSPELEIYEENLSTKIVMRQLGLEYIRASMVDRHSLVVYKSWSLYSEQALQDNSTESENGLDSSFVAASQVDFGLENANPEITFVRKLSPRLWSFIWLSNKDRLILVEARYRESHNTLDGKETALVRLLYLNLVQKDSLAADKLELDDPEISPTRTVTERKFAWPSLFILLMMCLSALVAGWIAFVSIPTAREEQLALQAENKRLQAKTEQIMLLRLTKSLAAGDYGDLQEELSGFLSLDYFSRALVLNSNLRVVASAGQGNLANIGETAPESLVATSKFTTLKQGQEVLGRIIYTERTAREEKTPLFSLDLLAAFSALLAIAATIFFLLFVRRR